jgi:hypothetical protein
MTPKIIDYNEDKDLVLFLQRLDEAAENYAMGGKLFVHYPESKYTPLKGADLMDLVEQVKELFPRAHISFRQKHFQAQSYAWWEIPVTPDKTDSVFSDLPNYSVSAE